MYISPPCRKPTKKLSHPVYLWVISAKALVLAVEAGHQPGPGGDDVRQPLRPQHLVHRHSVPGDGNLEDEHAAAGHREEVGEVFRQQHPVPEVAGGDQGLHLPAVPPRPLVLVVGGQQHPPGLRGAAFPQHPHRLHGRGDAPLHVGAAGAVEHAVLDARGHERQVHGVEVAVHLQDAPALSETQARHHRRGLRPVADRALDLEAVGPKQLVEAAGDSPGAQGRAGDLDEGRGRLQQAVAVHRGLDLFSQFIHRSVRGYSRLGWSCVKIQVPQNFLGETKPRPSTFSCFRFSQ